MYSQWPRWGRLLFLAVTNLMLWVDLAVVVWQIASDDMNLDLETLIRKGQAAASAYLSEPAATEPAWVAAPTVARPTGPVVGLVVTAENTPEHQVRPTGQANVLPTLQPTKLPSLGSHASPAALQPTTIPRPEVTPTAWHHSAAPAAGPIILVDPEFSGLMQANSDLDSAPAGQRVQLRYEEGVLNQEIAALLAQSPDLPYRNVQVQLEPDRVVVTGEVTVLGIDLSAELLGRLGVENCAPRVDVQAVSVGGILTPRFIKNQAATIVLDALDWYPADSPVCLDGIVLEDGAVTVYGYRR